MGAIDTNKVIGTFCEVARDPDKVAKDWKARGRKVVGYRCIYVPEEIIWAADMLPYPLYGTPDPVGAADSYFTPYTCEFTRNLFDHALNGRFSFLDHLVLPYTCEMMGRLFEMWDDYIEGVPVYMISTPHKLLSESNRDLYRGELARLRAAMEELSGNRITDKKLQGAIDLLNETRGLLRELSSLRKQNPPPISGEETLDIVMAVSVMPKDQANPLLGQLLEEVKARETPDKFGPRILVTGSIMDNPALIRMIEEEGGAVVADNLCTGNMYSWYQVEEHEDPLEALYRFENRRPLCPSTYPMEARIQFLQELVDEFQVDGVIYFVIKYCHTLLHEAPLMKRALEAKGIRTSILEVGHDTSGHGQLRTRIQAFIEMLE